MAIKSYIYRRGSYKYETYSDQPTIVSYDCVHFIYWYSYELHDKGTGMQSLWVNQTGLVV